jgi:hypothetical protein
VCDAVQQPGGEAVRGQEDAKKRRAVPESEVAAGRGSSKTPPTGERGVLDAKSAARSPAPAVTAAASSVAEQRKKPLSSPASKAAAAAAAAVANGGASIKKHEQKKRSSGDDVEENESEEQAADDVKGKKLEKEKGAVEDEEEEVGEAQEEEAEDGEEEEEDGDAEALASNTAAVMEEKALTDVRFDTLELSEPTKAALKEMGFEFMTEIQARTLPALLAGKDVLGAARTGSGKTLAFLIPAVAVLCKAKFLSRNGTAVHCFVISTFRRKDSVSNASGMFVCRHWSGDYCADARAGAADLRRRAAADEVPPPDARHDHGRRQPQVHHCSLLANGIGIDFGD